MLSSAPPPLQTPPYPQTELTQIDQIAERVDRLLVRYDELLRSHTLLRQEHENLVQERDAFKARLIAARACLDTLLDRLSDVDAASVPAPVDPRASTGAP